MRLENNAGKLTVTDVTPQNMGGALEMAGALTNKQKTGGGETAKSDQTAIPPTEAVGNSWATLFMSSSKVLIQMQGNGIALGLLRSNPLHTLFMFKSQDPGTLFPCLTNI